MTNPPTSPLPDTDITLLRQEVADLRNRLARLEKYSLRLDELFRPEIGFLAACLFSIAFALFCIVYFRGDEQYYYLSYIVPIGFPFVGFLFDRLDRFFRASPSRARLGLHHAIDLFVVLLAVARTVTEIPYISGHALFLTYALLTVKSWWARVPAAVVLLEVIYFKVFLWSDVSVAGGIALGLAAVALTTYLHRTKYSPATGIHSK